MLILTAAAAAAAGILIIWMLFKTATPPLYGVYQLPGKWYRLKYLVMRCMLWMRERRRQKSDPARVSDSSAGYGIKSKKSAQEMEKPQQLSGDDHALDAVYICGLDKDGSCLVMRIGRKHGRRSELWLSLRLAGVGILQSPIHPATTVYNTDSGHFEADGLRFECVEPHNTWRVMFNGLLRKGICKDWEKLETDYSEMVHVQFSFLWCCSTDVFDFDTDIDHGLMADSLAREPWSSQYWEHLRNKHQTHYEQWGELRGVVKVEGEKDRHLHLRSLRDHSYGSRDWKLFHRYVVHLVQLEDGRNFHLSTISLPSTLSHLQCGYLNQPNMIQHPISWTDFNMAEIGETLNPPDKYSFKFKAGDTLYQTSVSCDDTAVYYMENDWGCVVYERMSTFTVNGVKGYGITEFCYRRPGGDCPLPPQQSVPMLVPPLHIQPSDEKALTLCFDHPACCSSRLVGGKGCQLALLTQMKDKDFIVPPGFCLTITAFETQLQQNQNLLKLIEELSAVSSGRKTGDLQSSCQAVVNSFLSTDICSTVHQHIQSKLEEVFPGYDTQQFAVRSSATGEDSKEMSAAGQMDTILGVKGMSQITNAVRICWASQFTHLAVEYRRQYGQPVESAMGVVIQKMIPAESAGVLFTCDPVTGNPKFLVLNANYGLGESVVSGGTEPDTVVISRSVTGQLSITNTTIGSKETYITTTEEGGTVGCDTAPEQTKRCCVSDKHILRLAAIAIHIETSFSDARDIEWAVADENIYLLQARPITTLHQESEDEIIHEFDTPGTLDGELYTTANITEVLPGALTPMTISTIIPSLNKTVQRVLLELNIHEVSHSTFRFTPITANHGFLNMHVTQAVYDGYSAMGDKRVLELALLGRTLESLTMESLKSYHGSAPLWKRIIIAIQNWKIMSDSSHHLMEWVKRLETYQIGEHETTAAGVYSHIMECLPDLFDCMHYHILNSSRSASWSLILLAVLSKGEHEWSTEHISDMAMLLSKCENVFSADVPMALQKLAELLESSNEADIMRKSSPEEALEWLRNGAESSIRSAFSQFLEKHGHRCIREMEVHSKSWRSDPTQVVRCLQTMMKNGLPSRPSQEEDPANAIDKLKTPLSTGSKFVLKKLLPRARRAVCDRELSKSTVVKCCDKFKDALHKLAALMKKEGFLPDEDLLFYFSLVEIGKILKDRPAKLIIRAQKRRKLLPKQDSLDFDLLQWGKPKPINVVDESENVVTSFKLTGMPVSQGVAKGAARVIRSLDQANSIQRGEILIVHTTDIGWSPYFPLIAGVVTELGGLLSHGAVVAREYGIPCVVGARGALNMFKTGDTVLLSGTNGTLEKIES